MLHCLALLQWTKSYLQSTCKALGENTCKALGDNFVENVVYQELLQDELIWRRNMQVGGPLKPVCIRVQSTDEPDSESDGDNEIYQF